MRIFPLIQANLKEFLRNWKSLLILLVFPLLLISTVFVSFSAKGLSRIPGGIVSSSFEEVNNFEELVSFLSLTKYGELDSCLNEIKKGKEYLCIEPVPGQVFTINVHFDNTKEPIIWEIIEKTKYSVDFLQEQKSKEKTTVVLNQFRNIGTKIGSYNQGLDKVTGLIDSYGVETAKSINELSSTKVELNDALDSMKSDIDDIEISKSELEQDKRQYFASAYSKLNYIDSQVNQINYSWENAIYLNYVKTSLAEIRNELDSYNRKADNSLDKADSKISKYRMTHAKGKTYVYKIDNSISNLNSKKKDLANYRSMVYSTRNELSDLSTQMGMEAAIDPASITQPIVVVNKPIYSPDAVNKPEIKSYTKEEGLNLIGLQTIFPQMLFLIVMFLSLLISSFITLTEINSTSNIRISIIEGISIHEFLATFFSSFIIVIIPIILVLLAGENLFRLHILSSADAIFFLMLLLASIFIFIGMLFSYLIKEESMTLVVITFALLFFIFISGYILPVERMSPFARAFAEISPGKISLSAFNRIVFYNQTIGNLWGEMTKLMVWFIGMLLATYIVKRMKNY
jgi:ABC-type multidrug transport system permease subunit